MFALANAIFLPIIWVFYPETSGRTLEELDVLFAHSYLTYVPYFRNDIKANQFINSKRRPTIIAEELPKLTDHQINVMTEKYDIHGGASDLEANGTIGAATGSDEPDTTLPPTHPSGLEKVSPQSDNHRNAVEGEESGHGSGLSTRVPSMEEPQMKKP